MSPILVTGICVLLFGPLEPTPVPAGDSVRPYCSLTAPLVPGSDPWFSEDKFMHFSASAGICGSVFYLIEYRMDGGANEGALYSLSITGLIGLGKETYDRMRGRRFSLKDLVWDAAGIAAGYFIFVHQY